MPTKELYIFDFDDTLVSDCANIYVHHRSRSTISLDIQAYYNFMNGIYDENEVLDITEFDSVKNPKVYVEMVDKLKSVLDKAVILTARRYSEPVADYMLTTLGIDIPVYAIGVYVNVLPTKKDSANRKRIWIEQQIIDHGYDYVEFWDDAKVNIEEAEKLKVTFPNVTFVLHHVCHKSD